MKYPLKITTEPVNEPVVLSDVKEYFREDRSVEDSLIDRQIEAARRILERHTGYHLIDTVFKMYLKDFEDVKIPKKPLKSDSVSIEYVDEDGNTQTLSTDKYNVHEVESPASIEFLDNLPDLDDEEDTRYPVIITFTVGYGTSQSDVPADWKDAVSLMAFLIWQRDGEDVNPLNYSLMNNYLQNYRIGRFK